MKDIGNVENICPYCSKPLSKRPQQKAQCHHCNKSIFVRTRPSDRRRVLVTEDQAIEVKALWNAKRGVRSPRIEKKEGFDDEKKVLTKRFGCEPSDTDVIWSLLNKELIEHSRTQNWIGYRTTIFDMGELLRGESKWSDALQRYFEVCYLDLNGPCNYGNVSDINADLLSAGLGEEIKPFNPDRGELFSGVLALVEYLAKSLGMDPDKAHKQFIEIAAKFEKTLRLPLSPEVAWKSLEKEVFGT